MEAHITAGLNHRNVVRTIAHAWRPLVSHMSASMSVWDSAGSNAVGPFTSCNEGETWLLLELCDKGTLQVITLPFQATATRYMSLCKSRYSGCQERVLSWLVHTFDKGEIKDNYKNNAAQKQD